MPDHLNPPIFVPPTSSVVPYLGDVMDSYVDSWNWTDPEIRMLYMLATDASNGEAFVSSFKKVFPKLTMRQAFWFWKWARPEGKRERERRL